MSWKSIVKTVAPVLGTALGGPFGGMAMKAISAAVLPEEQQGLAGHDLEAALESAITGNQEMLLKLKEADQTFDIEMKRLDVDIMKIDAGDRADARGMAASTTLFPQMIIAGLYVVGFIIVLWAVFTGKVALTTGQKEIAMYLLGILSAGLLQIMNFFYGSSSGSKEKTAKMAVAK